MKVTKFNVKTTATTNVVKYKKGDELNGIVLQRGKTIKTPSLALIATVVVELNEEESNFLRTHDMVFLNGTAFMILSKLGNSCTLANCSTSVPTFEFLDESPLIYTGSAQSEGDGRPQGRR